MDADANGLSAVYAVDL